MKIVTKSFLLLFVVGFATANDSKIVGGVETTIEDVPYQLELERGTLGILWSFSCGAVIIGPNAVLTAGHCVNGARSADIRFRSGDKTRGQGQIHTTVSISLHPNYTETEISDNDIAFVTVTPPFQLSNSTQPITVATTEPQAGENATISGWGVTSETGSNAATVVRKVTVPIISREECSQDYSNDEKISEAMICAGLPEGGKDSCSGDSGGPLVVNGNLAGLVSWGYGCAEAGSPGVYTNVALFSSWVQAQIDATKLP